MKRPDEHISGVLLIGGSSRRFGSDKAVSRLEDGRSLIEHTFDTLRAVTSPILISINEVGRTYPIEAHSTSVQYVVDEWSDCGPLAGIASALQICKTQRIFVMAVDLPYVSRESCERMIAASLAGANAPLTIAKGINSGKAQPLCGIWHQSVLGQLRQYIDLGSRSVMGFLDQLSVNVIELPDKELINVNRPTDIDSDQRG